MGVGGGTKSQREIWLPRESEPRRLQVFTRPGQEEEEARVQIRVGAGKAAGYPPQFHWDKTQGWQGGKGEQGGPTRTGLRCPGGANPGLRAPPAGRPTSQRGEASWEELLNSPTPLNPGGWGRDWATLNINIMRG